MGCCFGFLVWCFSGCFSAVVDASLWLIVFVFVCLLSVVSFVLFICGLNIDLWVIDLCLCFGIG